MPTVRRRKRNSIHYGVLPTSKSKVCETMEEYVTMIYGRNKIGKTTLTSMFEGQLHFCSEEGTKSLGIMKIVIPETKEGWELALQAKEELLEGNSNFKNIILDTGPRIYNTASEYICSQMNLEHLGDAEWGKGWGRANKEFNKFHLDLIGAGFGMTVIAHDYVREMTKENGEKYDQIYPRMSRGAEDFYSGSVDTIAYYRYVNGKRWLQIRGDEHILAGTRLNKNFLTRGGEPIFNIPMGESEDESYENFVKAFNNQQRSPFKDLKDVTTEDEAYCRKKELKVFSRKKR